MLVIIMAISVLAVTLCSSAYSGGKRQLSLRAFQGKANARNQGIPGLHAEFHASTEVEILGLSLFVLGFAIGRESIPATIDW
jgi:hypothetical protein